MEQRGRMQIVTHNTFMDVEGYAVGFGAFEAQRKRRSVSCPPTLASAAVAAAPMTVSLTAPVGAGDEFPMGRLVYWCCRDAAYGQRGVIVGASSYFAGS